MKLLHKLLPASVNENTLESISKNGLLPRLPSEYRQSLPVDLQTVPLVWLAERMHTTDGVIYSVDADKLEDKKLHKLGWTDTIWWVYEGVIPSALLEEVK